MEAREVQRHPLVDVDAAGKPRYPWYHLLWVFVGIVAASSAYLVYQNGASHLPISVSFFWFSLFAALATFFYPDDLTSAVFLRGVGWKTRWHLLYPHSPWRGWWGSFRNGGLVALIIAAVADILYFVFLLLSLQVKREEIAVTLLVLQQLNPLVVAWLGFAFLKDTCQNWGAYITGTLITGFGIFLYQEEWSAIRGSGFFDRIVWLAIAIIVCSCVFTIARAVYRRKNGVDALYAMQSIEVISTMVGFFWMVGANDGFVWLTSGELTALAYIGFVPTAFTAIVVSRSQDLIGIPLTATIGSLRPLLVLLLGLIPLSWFHITTGHFTFIHYLGMGLAIAGLLITVWLAKPETVSQDE